MSCCLKWWGAIGEDWGGGGGRRLDPHQVSTTSRFLTTDTNDKNNCFLRYWGGHCLFALATLVNGQRLPEWGSTAGSCWQGNNGRREGEGAWGGDVQLEPCVLMKKHWPVSYDVMSVLCEEVAVLPPPVCASDHKDGLNGPTDVILDEEFPSDFLFVPSLCISFSFIVSLHPSYWKLFFCFTHQGVGIIIPRQSQLLEFRFLVGFLLFFPCARAKSFSFLYVCSSGSSSTEEEHDRVPRGDEYSNPGCSGSDQWLAAQCRGWSWQLEESRCQSLQRLLQLQHWSGALWKGTANQNRASSFYDNYLWLMYCRILTEDFMTLNLFIKQNKLSLAPLIMPVAMLSSSRGRSWQPVCFCVGKVTVICPDKTQIKKMYKK